MVYYFVTGNVLKLQWQRGNQKCEIGAIGLNDDLHKTGFGYIWF